MIIYNHLQSDLNFVL